MRFLLWGEIDSPLTVLSPFPFLFSLFTKATLPKKNLKTTKICSFRIFWLWRNRHVYSSHFAALSLSDWTQFTNLADLTIQTESCRSFNMHSKTKKAKLLIGGTFSTFLFSFVIKFASHPQIIVLFRNNSSFTLISNLRNVYDIQITSEIVNALKEIWTIQKVCILLLVDNVLSWFFSYWKCSVLNQNQTHFMLCALYCCEKRRSHMLYWTSVCLSSSYKRWETWSRLLFEKTCKWLLSITKTMSNGFPHPIIHQQKWIFFLLGTLNQTFHILSDYCLFVRLFLVSKEKRIKKCYIYIYNILIRGTILSYI
jgi:hypothetical protein